MTRLGIALLLLAGAVFAQETVREAYQQARRKRGKRQRDFAAEQAPRFEGQVDGTGHMYLAYLWRYAKEWDKAANSFSAYIAISDKPKNRATASVEYVRALLEARRFEEVPPAVRKFRGEFPSHKYLSQMLFGMGRADRALNRVDQALDSFRAAAREGYAVANYEVIDCLLLLGQASEARREARNSPDAGSPRMAALQRALPQIGRSLPKQIAFSYWAGEDLASAEVKDKPVVLSFWATNLGKTLNHFHNITNGVATRFGKKIHVIAPTVYTQFNPVKMSKDPEMSRREEQGFVDSWKEQYELKFSLVLMDDNSIHELCGIDPVQPTLPAFAVFAKGGELKYVRFGGSAWAGEALQTAVKRISGG